MAGFDFEREIKKDVQNNPIVREVDSARQRELWRSVGIGVFLVLVLLFSAWQHFELLQNGYRIEQMQQDRARELEVNRHLRLEIATLKAPRRIEHIARDQLGMVSPPVGETIVIERVSPIGADPWMMARRGETQRKATGELVADVAQHP